MRLSLSILLFIFLTTHSAFALKYSGKTPPEPSPIDQKIYESLSTSSAPCVWKRPGTQEPVGGSTCYFKMAGSLLCTVTTNGTVSPAYQKVVYSCTIINMPDANYCFNELYNEFDDADQSTHGGIKSRSVTVGSETFGISKNVDGAYAEYGSGETRSRYPQQGYSKCDRENLCASIASAVASPTIEDGRISGSAIRNSEYCRQFYIDRDSNAKVNSNKSKNEMPGVKNKGNSKTNNGDSKQAEEGV